MDKITNLNDLLAATVVQARRWGASPWWRGQADYEWKLIPGAFRNGRTHVDERNMAARFMNKARTRRADCPRDDDLPGWLALMQHYRLPTRLLDWTEFPLVALFFAVDGLPQKDGRLWVLHPFQWNKAMFGAARLQGPNGTEAQPLLRNVIAESPEASEKVLALTPWESDLRMLLQASAFTVHDGPSAIEDAAAAKDSITSYSIPAANKAGILQHLNLLGIRRSAIFPDLENLAADLTSFQYGE